MTSDLAIPTLPSRNLNETIAFYEGLGFQVCSGSAYLETYVILRRGTIELHFFHFADIDPAESYGGCYLRVSNVDDFFQEMCTRSLPSKSIPRLGPLEDKPWGMREFHLIDPSGNLLRIGQILSSSSNAAFSG